MNHNTTVFTLTTIATATIIIITYTTNTATKPKTTAIKSNPTAIATGAFTNVHQPSGIKAKILGNIITALK